GGPPDASRQAEPAPHPLLALACDELVDDEVFRAGFGEPLGVRAPYVEGHGGMGNVATAALALGGAPRCAGGADERYREGAVVRAGFGEPLGVRAPYVEGYGGMGNVATAALALAGATRCAWGDDERYLEVDVLPAAEAEWERLEAELQMFQPQEGAYGEAAWF